MTSTTVQMATETTVVQVVDGEATVVQTGVPVTVTTTGGGGGVTDATYVTLSTNGTLTDERVLTQGDGIVITDAGAGSTVTIAVNTLGSLEYVGGLLRLQTNSVATNNIIDGSVTNAKLDNSAEARIKGRASGAGTGAPTDLTAAQAKTILGITTSDVSGLGTVSTLASDTDGTLAANSDSNVASQKATKTYADTKVPKSTVTAKGDLIAATASGTVTNVAVGANGKALKADSTASAGVAWDYAVPAAGAPKQTSTTYYVQPGVFASGTTAFGMTALLRYFDFLVVQTPITVDQIAIEQTAAAAAGKLFRMFLIAADKWWQPTGSVLIDSGTFAADGANGVKTYTPGSPVLLPAGRYLASVHSDGGPSIRVSVGGAIGQGFATTIGSSSSIYQTRTTYIALNASDTTAWDNLSFTTAPSSHFMWLRVSDPTS